MDPVQEIKSKLSIEDVVAPYVTLKKKGKYLKACCPFHQEKTPSFVVSVDRQMAYCFGCNKGGDVFQFIQDIEGLDFRGALEFLAESAGVTLPKGGGGPKVSKDKKDILKAVNRAASNFFVQELWEGANGEKVLNYLRNRGITDEIIREFQVGFAPEGKDTLYRHLLEEKHNKDAILESSLGIARDSEANKVFDRFHLRLMFPIQNGQGDYVAFGGRALKRGDNPKYLNSPEYVLYNKGAMLYNLHRAKPFMRESGEVVFVEGYFDVMASHQAGIKNVVATSGTALSETQFKLVKRYAKKVSLAFDSDSAGQDALLRAIETAQPLGLEIFVVEIPEGKDAADAVKEDASLWVDAVNSKVHYLEFFLKKYQTVHDLSSPGGKKAFTDDMSDLLRGLSHPVERDHYLKEISKLVGTPVDMLYDLLKKRMSGGRKHRRVEKSEAVDVKKTKQARLLEEFFGLLLSYPSVFFEVWESHNDFSVFQKASEKLGLIKQLTRLNEENLPKIRDQLETFLSKMDFEVDASRVYKQIRDNYNLRGELDEGFYADAENPDFLRKIAFEAEVKTVDEKLVSTQIETLITLLYLEFVTSKSLNGQN